jgi:hypothetical protein
MPMSAASSLQPILGCSDLPDHLEPGRSFRRPGEPPIGSRKKPSGSACDFCVPISRNGKLMDMDQDEFRKGLAEPPSSKQSKRKEQINYAELV